MLLHFNPRAPCGARQTLFMRKTDADVFQPTRSLRGATCQVSETFEQIPISTHALLAGRDARITSESEKPYISTHALLAGRDGGDARAGQVHLYFNPRAPCGARHDQRLTYTPHKYFNPRAPCGARQQKCTNHYAHFCDNRQISDAFAQNAACQGILLLFDAGKP